MDLRLAPPGSAVARRTWQVLILTIVLGERLMGQTTDLHAAQRALDRGDYKRAEEVYRTFMSSGPASAELLNNLGIALHLQGKSSEAIAVLRRALRLKEMPGTLALLGLSYCRLRQFDDAVPFWSAPSAISPIRMSYPCLDLVIWMPASRWMPSLSTRNW